ncbi:MAG: helix-turn-helix domain-containing protein [Pseudobdellovibrio sp.]
MFTKYKIKKTHLTVSEAAFICNVAAKTIYNWKNDGKLKATNLGNSIRGRLRIPIEEIERITGGKISITEDPNVDK